MSSYIKVGQENATPIELYYTFDRLARDAEQNCPVSRVLRAEITLDARLL